MPKAWFELAKITRRQRPLDTGSRQVNQHVDAVEQAIDDGRIAQIAVHDVLTLVQRHQRSPAPRRAQVDAALLEFGAKNPAHVAAGARERNLGHRGHPL
jgi:hypothetical protein